MKYRMLLMIVLAAVVCVPAAADDAAVAQAERSAKIAGYSLSKVKRWLHETALKRIDPETGLYIADGRWNYRDTAADCYPFLVWAAHVVDREALEGPVRAVLHAERKLCNYRDGIPVPYDLKKKKKVDPGYDQMMFQASEYVKDGLIAIVEVTGRDEWFDRMKEIQDGMWKNAKYETPFGKIPSKNVEVNGEQIQALVRLYTMTGEERYIRQAEILADYYLHDEAWVPRRLRDHGCEIIGGLGLLLGVESQRKMPKADGYKKRIRKMLDEILARGINADGIMYNTLGQKKGRLSDGWGYNYVTYLCYDMVADKPVYRERIVETLRALAKPQYRDYPWEGRSIDGYADSIEGGLYILNRLPVAEGLAWADRETAANVVHADRPLKSCKLWGTMKLQSNGVRTTLIHALMHTRGIIARPWRIGLEVGAAEGKDGLAVVVKSNEPWKGTLVFDVPRHRLFMGFARDWPRMNTMPEWYTVEPGGRYAVREGKKEARELAGKQLADGLAIAVKAGGRAVVSVRKK